MNIVVVFITYFVIKDTQFHPDTGAEEDNIIFFHILSSHIVAKIMPTYRFNKKRVYDITFANVYKQMLPPFQFAFLGQVCY